MSLQQAKLLPIVARQYRYKLKSHANLLVALVIVQIIGLGLTALGGTGMSNASSSTMTVNVTHYSSTIFLAYTLLWALVVGILLNLKGISNLDFAFISNRLTSNIANAALLLTFSVLGGVTSALGRVLLRCLIYFSGRGPDIVGTSFYVSPGDLLGTAFVIALYLAVLSMLGYFIGVMVRRWRILIAVFPTVLIGILFLEARVLETQYVLGAVSWFTEESSLGIFILKVVAAFGLTMVGSVMVSQRMEVRQ